MFDKIIKVALVILLASLLGVAGWFCWAHSDAGTLLSKTGQGCDVVC
jgi:hypothetical protein